MRRGDGEEGAYTRWRYALLSPAVVTSQCGVYGFVFFAQTINDNAPSLRIVWLIKNKPWLEYLGGIKSEYTATRHFFFYDSRYSCTLYVYIYKHNIIYILNIPFSSVLQRQYKRIIIQYVPPIRRVRCGGVLLYLPLRCVSQSVRKHLQYQTTTHGYTHTHTRITMAIRHDKVKANIRGPLVVTNRHCA